MSDDTTIEGTADELPPHDEGQVEPSAALAVVDQPAGAIIRAEQPDEIIAKATQIANSLSRLIEAQNLAKNLGGNRKHVEVGGWQALGSMLGALGGQPLHAETIWTRRVLGDDGQPQRTRYTAEVKHYEWKTVNGRRQREHARTTTYDVDGYDWEACVEVRTPGGVVVGRAEAMCSRAEATWARRDDYAVRSMAETRAESRAYRRAVGWIVHIAGYNPTPAEEMPPDQPAQKGPPHGPEIAKGEKAIVMTALREMFGDYEGAAHKVAREVVELAGGYMPEAVGRALVIVASRVTALRKESDLPWGKGYEGPGGEPADAEPAEAEEPKS